LGVGTSHGHFHTQNSPRLRLRGSHHLPPYSSLCVSPQRLHSNGYFSRDSQVGVPKLSRVGVLGLWTLITLHPKLRSGRGLNQSCSSRRELSKAVSYFFRQGREEVDSRLLVVGSQIGSLTPTLLLLITWAEDVQMAHARSFWAFTLQEFSIDIKNTQMREDLTPQIVF